MTKIITLSGFGDFCDHPLNEKELREAAYRHGVEFYSTYYDHELKGDRDAIEAITEELWSMSRDEWGENALIETEI